MDDPDDPLPVAGGRGRRRVTTPGGPPDSCRCVGAGGFGHLRDARRTWRAETNRTRHGRPPIDETTTLVVSSWQFLGTGYTPAEQLIADTVRHNNAVLQQQRREGGGL